MSDYIIRKSIRPLPGKVIKTVPIPKPEIISGFGSRAEAGAVCSRRGFRKALLVTDANISRLGYAGKVCDSLAASGVEFSIFDKIDSEPDCRIIEEGRKAAVEFGADCIIGLGGGSVMDSCKMIAAASRLRSVPVRRLLLKFLPVPDKTLPIINIPSTAGTGAEMTVGAVITGGSRKKSTVIVGLDVTDVILDSELTVKMPRSVTAACGIDALSHGLEGAVAAVNTDDEDRWKSLECIRIALTNLPEVLEHPDNADARQQLCLAANYGGNAINRQLAGYVHAFAHAIGARYHIPHGNAIALCLLPVMKAQRESCEARLAMIARHCAVTAQGGIREAADSLFEALESLIKLCDLPPFEGIPEEDIAPLIKAINADSINYSAPVTFTDAQIKEILSTL